MKKLLSIVLTAVLMISVVAFAFGMVTSAANATMTYAFTHPSDPGYAQGTITVSVGPTAGGKYFLYWADDNAALEGFDPIATLTVNASGSKSFTMPEFTAIPADATKVVGFLSSATPTNKSVSAATAVYEIPAEKQIGHRTSDALYTFAAFSDFHMSEGSYGLQNYPYDNQHAASAFKMAADRNVDFVVTTGDHVNNQREDDAGGNNPYYGHEWSTYLKILSQSDYYNPIYEAIGNHELWNYDTESVYRNMDWQTGSRQFVNATGLDSTAATINSGKAYFEITEPVTGDHFLFMALEGGFYTDRVDEYSDDQLNWLEGKLKAYENDGKNTFILQHCNFEKWGAGDRLDVSVYNLPLKDKNASTLRLKNILKTYKNAIMINGHTHFRFALQLNYSTNKGTSATIIHNSSVGAVRDIDSKIQRVNDKTLAQTEGYLVEVYDNATLFYGINLYYNQILPTASYIIPTTTSSLDEPYVPTEAPTEAPTDPPTEPPTEAPTPAPTEPPTQAPTQPKPTDPPTEPPTEAPTIHVALWGDVNLNNKVEITDVTAIQRHLAGLETLSPEKVAAALVDGTERIKITDATLIQRYLADIISVFPVEELAVTAAQKDEPVSSGDAQEILTVSEEEFALMDEEELADTGADVIAVQTGLDAPSSNLSTLRTQANNALSKYFYFASYNQYQALKKAIKTNADYDVLLEAYNGFDATVKAYHGDNIDIYFTNNQNWSTVYAYCWNDSTGSVKNATWPGQKMTRVGSSNVYKLTVPTGKYNYIIFNNNSAQSIDLPLGLTNNVRYYLDGQTNGKYKGKMGLYN